MPTLDELQTKYFPAGVGTGGPFDANSVVKPIIDGVDYFAAIYASMQGTSGAADAIYVLTWEFDPDFRLIDDPPGGSAISLGALLRAKARAQVDVRIVLNGNFNYRPYGVAFKPFQNNLKATRLLRSDPALRDRILYDYSGASATGSHHQKALIVRSATELVAYVGGMNLIPNHRDAAPHNLKHYPDGSPWGWHDVGLRLTGEAVKGVLENFRRRWVEAAALPQPLLHTTWEDVSGIGAVTKEFGDPLSPPPLPSGLTSPVPVPTPTQASVRVLASRYQWKKTVTIGSNTPWLTAPQSAPLTQVYDVLKQAISQAQRYIYIEDQFLSDQFAAENIPAEYSLFDDLAARVNANPILNVILVGSGRGDPDDLVVLRLLRGAGGQLNLTRNDNLKTKLFANLDSAVRGNVAVWRVLNATVHSKLVMIDDEFLSIGSANFQSRSMYGVDAELQVATVATDTTIQDFRVKLWAEHLRLASPIDPAAESALRNIEAALGIWGDEWYLFDEQLWHADQHPFGYDPAASALREVPN